MGQPGTPATEKAGNESSPATAETAENKGLEGEIVGEILVDGAEKTTSAPPALGAELEALRSELDERLRDLQRVTAEYANYRKRVERDRGVVAEQAVGMVISALLPILDDLDRAREHGDLVGPFAAVAEQFNARAGEVRPDRLRRAGRRVRPDPARGGGASDVRRGHRADVRGGHAPRLPARRPAAARSSGRGGRSRMTSTRSDVSPRNGRR